jgi:hypothetical protein
VTRGKWLLLAMLVFDAIALALLELFFLPLRFDGTLLPDLDGFPFPITVVLAAFTMPLLVKAAASIAPRMSVASAPLVAWGLCLLIFAATGPGGEVVVLADWRALLLLVAGGLPAAVVLGGVPLGALADRRATSTNDQH